MGTDAFFFKVEHDLLRSAAFQALGGSAIKVYLVIGLYSDFGTGWAYPSIRTIARQAGLSRQTVLDAIADLAGAGLVATTKSPGRSTAYRLLRPAPARPSAKRARDQDRTEPTVPKSFRVNRPAVPDSFLVGGETGPDPGTPAAQGPGPGGPGGGPKRDPGTREDDPTSIPIPGTPFRLSAEGRLLVAVDLQGLLTDQGIPPRLAERLAAQKDPEDVAKVLLNAFYLRSQGKLQNGPGYIRAGLEEGYELLPQVAHRLEDRRRELQVRLRSIDGRREEARREAEQTAEEDAINLLISSLRPEDLQQVVRRAVGALPEPLVRRNPTLSNPFVRAKVYELAGGEPLS